MDNQLEEIIIEQAVNLAEAWQNRANALLTHEEKAIQEQMARLLTRPLDKIVLTKLIDQSFRSENPARIADQIESLLSTFGVPDFFGKVDKLLMQMFLGLGHYFPSVVIPKMIDKMRKNSSRAIIPGEEEALYAHLAKRKSQGVRMNLNHLGEAVLGEKEAARRLQAYLADLSDPEIECISVKISTIYSQVQPLAFEHTVQVLVDRLTLLYRAARDNDFTRHDGTIVHKLVNLDMEEYRDLEITVTAFTRALGKEEFLRTSAGIVLQAYLPDSYLIQKALTDWAKKRVKKGGSPINLRIVKGANMEMEQVESAIHGWPLAPYDNKPEVDANYKRMIAFGLQPENIQAVRLGIASHNLFELAYAYKLSEHRKATEQVTIEMLEGMADHVRRALQETVGDLLLYAPTASKKEFINAIAYLIRRLDENTSPENFLRYAPNLKVESETWELLKNQFILSCRLKEHAGTTPHRRQNRQEERFSAMGTYYDGEFNNEPDTDWSLAVNRVWAEAIRKKWEKQPGDRPLDVPVVLGDREIFLDRPYSDCFDPNQLPEQVLVAQCALATKKDIDEAMSLAKDDPQGWRRLLPDQRHEVLSQVALSIRRNRGDLIGAATANTGKTFTEADVEVSEAVDFAEFYPFTAQSFTKRGKMTCRGKGVGLVIAPWNFPIAIPCGGIVASLAAGNTVVFKPSPDAIMVGWMVCRCFWEAGVPRSALQFLPCDIDVIGNQMTTHPYVDFIIFTGGTHTGMRILNESPEKYLAAETGGKNATIVTAMADRDQAIKNVVYSAFGNSGQKCSATSLLILEEEVYHDDTFKAHLVDAVSSLAVGSSWNFKNRLGPLIRPPADDLKKGLTRLESGENWALIPRNLGNNPNLWSPGIKYGVTPESYMHKTEFFGPVLAVMEARNLDQAITMVNGTGYGLTSGLESLDEREQKRWRDKVAAGNLYINRGTTGAIVLRQPFGGMGKSALGAGIKAGGVNYVSQFMEMKETGMPAAGPIQNDYPLLRLAHQIKQKLTWGEFGPLTEDLEKTVRAIKSYLYNFEQEFGPVKDYFHLRGQDNRVRYVPVGNVVIRVQPDDSLFDVLARIAAARIAQCRVSISLSRKIEGPSFDFLYTTEGKALCGDARVARESDEKLVDALPAIHRIRFAGPDRVPRTVLAAAAKKGFYIARAPVFMEGRVELIHYFQEQSLCHNYHRYGNLGERSLDDTQAPYRQS